MHLATFLDHTPAEQACREMLSRDIASARMSTAFRMYYRLRPFIPTAIRQQLQRSRNQRVDAPQGWYLPSDFFATIREALGNQSYDLLHPWPEAKRFCFTLTHDVETADGMRDIMAIADLEQELGFRSSWNLVPYKYPIDHAIVRELQDRGFEIGIHGYNHDGKLFWSEAIFRKRAVAINEALRTYDAVGFRAPMVHRNLDWLQALDVEYDASCFDIDPFQTMPGGIGSIWPAIVGKFIELPYTMPQDHTLFLSLGEQSTRIWNDKLDFIRQHSGMALMLTHPDYLNKRQHKSLYRDFLTEVQSNGDYWHALPKDVARWWRHYANTTASDTTTTSANENGFVRAKLSFGNGENLMEQASDSPIAS